MKIYQRISDSSEVDNFAFGDQIEDRRLYDLPQTITEKEECNSPNDIKPKCDEFSKFPNQLGTELANTQELYWLVAASFALKSIMEPKTDMDIGIRGQISGSPIWSALNSILSQPLPLTRIATPPLIAAPAHEFSTLLSVLKQAQKINTLIVGAEHKTIVSLDMGLYKPAKNVSWQRRLTLRILYYVLANCT